VSPARRVARTITLLASCIGVFVVAAPAYASGPSDGDVHGPPLGIALTIVFFIVVPLAVLAILAALSAVPTLRHRRDRTPGGLLDQKALWFHGPVDVQSSLADVEPGETARGGASADW
jgi:hypothetical protein